jgi:hypothetical protein
VPVDVDLEATSIDADEYLVGIHGGPRGDDGEDLGATDLFVARARDADDGGDWMATLSSTQRWQWVATTQKTRKTRARTSDVWNDFEELFNIVNGMRTRYGPKCHYCKKILTALSISGTGHLLRHRISCARKAGRASKTQYVLNYNSDGSVRNWDYRPEVAHVELCHLIARLDLSLGIGAYDAFVDYIRCAHNPRYALICTQTTTKDFLSILIKLIL